MKKAFVSIYVLLILLISAFTISFLTKENETNYDSVASLYNKKIAMYEAESILNIIQGEDALEKPKVSSEVVKNFDHKSEIEITRGKSVYLSKNKEDASVLTVRAKYKKSIAKAILTYKIDKEGKPIIIYRRVF